MKELTHRDEIHGDVDYDPLAVALLSTSALQRLGRVYQLGYGHLVYRGGTHTRLSHCMGTYATAARLVAALRHNYERKSERPKGAIAAHEFLPSRPPAPALVREDDALTLDVGPADDVAATVLVDRWTVLQHLVCWAALLHDVAHVPLGHTLEDEFDGIYEKHDDFASARLRYLWLGDSGREGELRAVLTRPELYPDAFHRLGLTDGEDVWATVFLICTWKERVYAGRRTTFQQLLRAWIDSHPSADHEVAELLLDRATRLIGTLFAPYMADIVANTISADYLDYLRRDPRNLGLDVLKDDRVVRSFWVGRDHCGQARMALSLEDRRGKPRLDTCTGVVELVRQRYRFAEIVYYHKTKVAASAMLAKVFHLVGAPPEIPARGEIPGIAAASDTVDRLLSANDRSRREQVRQLQGDYLPSALLDVEIGDESLGLLLRNRAWRKFEQAIRAHERQPAVDALQSIALLDGITRRALYKVCFSMDATQFKALGGRRESPEGEVERALSELIEDLRGDAGQRAAIEAQMVAAPSWSANSVLLYVPPRKSQAKGIETGALADGAVVTLGTHPAVKAAVQDLSDHYAALWRLIVLVHPEHVGDAVGLSDAVDAFVLAQFPGINLDESAIIDALEASSWFPYLRRRDRNAARQFRRLRDGTDDDIKWRRLTDFDGAVKGRSSEDELALGAALLDELARRNDLDTALARIVRYELPGALSRHVDELRGHELASASREGNRDADADVRATRAALDKIADELSA